ncbi:MAG: pentapeptide repeat-containing protein, partial [Methanothrix sp.]|nr:pentapeptide repeat-containing protein [Methanothrix sp.]
SSLSSFGEAVFADEANFNLARFSQAAYFSGAQFQGLALFGLTRFEDIASLQGAKFYDDLNFKGGSISTILLDKAQFAQNSRIILNDTDFTRFKAHWNEIEGYVVWDPGAYLALVNNYHGLGWSTDEDDCYYQYRNIDQGQKGWGWSKVIDILAWLSCGYGVRPSYAGAWSLIIIFLFALVYWKGDGIKKSAKPLHEPAEMYAVPGHVTLRNALFFSTMIFISRGPNEFLPVGRNRYYVILEGILGWLLLALFLVTLGRVMIR